MIFSPHPSRRMASALAAALGSLLLLAGCTSVEITTPERTGIEQLLLSTATDDALTGLAIPQVQGEKVYVDDRYLQSYDRGYVVASVRALLSENGALLQSTLDTADVVVEARSGALGIDSSKSLLGIPAVPLPIPGAGTLEIPQLAIYAATKEDAVAKIALLGYRKEGSNLFSTEPLVGKAHFNQYNFFFLVHLNFTNLPARDDY